MNKNLQAILNSIQQSTHLSDEEKSTLAKAVKDAEKEFAITEFKLDRTEKVKRTTAILLEETIAELEQKRKDVEAQNRDLEIEAALEKVRSRSLAMQKSDELADLSLELVKQVQALGVATWFCAFNIYNDKDSLEWGSNGQGTFEKYITPREGVFLRYYEAGQRGETLLINEIGEDECPAHYEYLCSLPGVGDQLVKMKAEGIPFPASQIDHVAFHKYGYLIFITYEPVPEAHDIFKRFAKVFEQTYTRFLDLQKAEAQAREAQIETALERVRSRSLGMQKSEELKEVIRVVFDQFVNLNIHVEHAGFIMDYKERDDMFIWLADKHAVPFQVTIPYFDCAHWNSFIDAKLKGKNFFANCLSFEEKNKFYQDLLKLFPVPDEAREYYLNCPGLAISTVLLDNVGLYIENFSGTVYSDEENSILMRFGKVFQQTYTRFLDLQKAEAQAREAQVETSLERVRSRSLAMHHTSELQEVINTAHKELLNLNIANDGGSFIAINKDIEKQLRCWGSGGTADTSEEVVLPLYEKPFCTNLINGIKNGPGFFTEEFSQQDKKDFFKYLFEHKPWSKLDAKQKKGTLSSPGGYTRSCCVSKHTSIFIINHLGERFSEADNEILKRFGKVFEQSYTRFLDLQKAEAQAREAQIEAALERVRSRTLAMQKSDELAETSAVLFQQLILLGIEPNRLYICIVKNENGDSEFWITDEDGSKVSMAYEDNLSNNSTLKKMFAGWKKQQKSLVIDIKGEDLHEYFKYLNSIHVPFKEGMVQQRRLQYIAYFNKGFIGMASPDEQPEDTLQLLERFAGVFNLTFTRFNDLKVAEAHALQAEQDLVEIKAARKNAEEALTELKSTQSQLIQSEKMASLGELTAGISHEIQNPLNFVNNFSEVSTELIDEMKEELAKGNGQLANEIADDLKQNLEKINHHGKRAGDIVKGMLQHSRTSSGQKEPTDINALCDEYLRLAYHGLRAKDKSFNATMKTEFDQGIGKINIIPQDIGRVILNLITNAFYAVNEKTKQNITGYEPIVDVSTKKEGKNVLITVKDNGNGIPKSIVDKIFQPFFTTKPTGQGTGLGLSLSYDIVKAHGGALKVQTLSAEEAALTVKVDEVNPDDFRKVEGTEFIIQLPFK